MSIRIMSKIWEDGPKSQSERFVLLALADYANDDGECWPSIAGISRKTCLTERGVRQIIRRLQQDGWLDVDEGGGRKNCNLYRVKTLNEVQSELNSAMNVVQENPERGSINTERGSTNTERGAAEPSITINKPSSLNKGDEILDCLCTFASREAALSFLNYRKKSKGKGLTLTAAKRLANNLKEIYNAGGDTDDALGLAEERGWQTIKPEWYFKSSKPRNSSADTTAREIAFAARAGRSPSLDSF